MDEIVFKCVEDFFDWKLKDHKFKIKETVEQYNKEKTQKLGWSDEKNIKKTDVLYSFLLIYQLGLKLTNKNVFDEILRQEKDNKKNDRLNQNSPNFLHVCSLAPEYKKFNESKELIDFLNVYFSIGNVIPIWPGGNTARGVMGIYDIPEIFFNVYSDWTKRLIELYPNASLEAIINPMFIVQKKRESGYNIKYYNKAFENKKQFETIVMNNKNAYYDYLIRRHDVIISREKVLLNVLKETV